MPSEKRIQVDLMYPRSPDSPHQVEIKLMSVRAADSIVIEYDFDRDGWVIRMDKTRDLGCMMEVVAELEEVAFIPAWNEVEE